MVRMLGSRNAPGFGSPVRAFSRVMTLRARRFAAQGDLNAALREWLKLQNVARLLADGEGYLITWLVAVAVAGVAHTGFASPTR